NCFSSVIADSSCADGICNVADRVRAESCGDAVFKLAMYPLWRCAIAFTVASTGPKSFTIKETDAVRAIIGPVIVGCAGGTPLASGLVSKLSLICARSMYNSGAICGALSGGGVAGAMNSLDAMVCDANLSEVNSADSRDLLNFAGAMTSNNTATAAAPAAPNIQRPRKGANLPSSRAAIPLP